MTDESAPPAGPSRHLRWLYYLVSTLLVTFVLKAGFPQHLCRFADGFHQRIGQVDPLFFVKQARGRFANENAARLRDIAEYGGPAALHSSAFGLALDAMVFAFRRTVAADRYTMGLTLLSLALALLLFLHRRWWVGPLTPILIILAAAGVAVLLRQASVFLSAQFGCNGDLFVAALAAWPVIGTLLSIRDTARAIEQFVERARARAAR